MSLSIHQKLIALAIQQPNSNTEVIQLLSVLTEQELKILIYLADDLTTIDIGEAMYITPKSVANYKNRIVEKMNFDGCRALRRFAIQHCELLKLLSDF